MDQAGKMILMLNPMRLQGLHPTNQHFSLLKVEMCYIKMPSKEVDRRVCFLSPCDMPTLFPYTLNGLGT